MRAVALSRLITLMLMVGPAAFAAPLSSPASIPASAGMPAPGDAPVPKIGENRNMPQEEVETNRDAVRVGQQGVSAKPKVVGPQNPDLMVKLCLIFVGRTPGEVIQTPTGPKVVNVDGQLFGDCQPDGEHQDETFAPAPGFINLADSDSNMDNGDNADTGSDNNDASTADETSPPASTDSTESAPASDGSTTNDSTAPASDDTTAPASEDTQDSGVAPSADGQDASPPSDDNQTPGPPADDEQPQTTGNQHATQPGGTDSFPAGAGEEVASGFSQLAPNGFPPSAGPAEGGVSRVAQITPNGVPTMPPAAGFPASPGSAVEAMPQRFPNDTPSTEQVSSFSPFSQFPPSGDIHAPSALSQTDAPFDPTALPASAIQAAQGVSPDPDFAQAGVMNLVDSDGSQTPKPAVSVEAEAQPLGTDC